MIRHLLKLVWNRKRSNALMILEICVSFLVVFVVATLGLFFLDNYRLPLGFEWKNVWDVRVGIAGRGARPAIETRCCRSRRRCATAAAGGPVARRPWRPRPARAVVPFDQGGIGAAGTINGKDVDMDARRGDRRASPT